MLPQLLHEEWNNFWSNGSNKKSIENMKLKDQNQILTHFVKSQIPGWPNSLDLESFLRDMTIDFHALIKTEILWKMKDSNDSRPILDIILNPDRHEELENLMHVIENELQQQFSRMDFSSEKAQKMVLTLLWFTSQPCNHFIKYCTWKGLVVACQDIFKLVPTDVGFCCSFNHASMPEMLRSSSYAKTIETIETNFYNYHQPKKSKSSHLWSRSSIDKTEIDLTPMKGKLNGLTVVIDLNSEFLKPSTLNQDYHAVQATVTPKDEFPFILADSILISPGQETHVAIKPMVTFTTDSLKDLEPYQRNCYFDNEFDLHLFSNYSVNSCWMECLMNLTMKELGPCTPWNFPKTETMRICTPYEQHQFLTIFRQIDMTKIVGSESCLPKCGGTDYEVQVTSAPFRRCDSANLGLSTLCHLGEPIVPQMWGIQVQDLYGKYDKLPDYITEQIQSPSRRYPKDMIFDLQEDYNAYKQDIAVATFYFPKHVAKELVRSPRMNTFDYVSQVGGLLGLCLGCSLISLIEIIYWISIGYCNKKSLMMNRKSSSVSNLSSSSLNTKSPQIVK